MHFWVYVEVDSPWVSIGSMCLHPPSSGAVNAPHTSNGDGSVLRTLPGQAPPPCVSTFLLSGLHGWEKVPHVEATHMFLAPLPFSPSLHLALKSTPDDFFFAPLSSYNPFLPSEKFHQARSLSCPRLPLRPLIFKQAGLRSDSLPLSKELRAAPSQWQTSQVFSLLQSSIRFLLSSPRGGKGGGVRGQLLGLVVVRPFPFSFGMTVLPPSS